MIPRSETMPAILAPSAETTRAPTFSSRMRCRASETVASGVMVHTSRPLLARMCSTFTGRSSPLHRARPEARVPQAPRVDRVRQDRSGLPPLELGQLTFRPDRVGQRPHPAIPVARLDARGLEDQVASGYRPAEPPCCTDAVGIELHQELSGNWLSGRHEQFQGFGLSVQQRPTSPMLIMPHSRPFPSTTGTCRTRRAVISAVIALTRSS